MGQVWIGTLLRVGSRSRLAMCVVAVAFACGITLVVRSVSMSTPSPIAAQPTAPVPVIGRPLHEPDRISAVLRSDDGRAVQPAVEAATETAAAETPAAEAGDQPQAEFIADEWRWPHEYESKPDAELAADAARLLREFQAELDAEVDRRFERGQWVVLLQDDPVVHGVPSGYRVSRRSEGEHAMRVVEIDPLVSPELFVKRAKSLWLTTELQRRRTR